MSKPRRRSHRRAESQTLRQPLRRKSQFGGMQRGSNPVYTWHRELAGAHTPVARRRWRRRSALEARVLQGSNHREVTEEYVTLKKKLGEPEWCLDSP